MSVEKFLWMVAIGVAVKLSVDALTSNQEKMVL